VLLLLLMRNLYEGLIFFWSSLTKDFSLCTSLLDYSQLLSNCNQQNRQDRACWSAQGRFQAILLLRTTRMRSQSFGRVSGVAARVSPRVQSYIISLYDCAIKTVSLSLCGLLKTIQIRACRFELQILSCKIGPATGIIKATKIFKCRQTRYDVTCKTKEEM